MTSSTIAKCRGQEPPQDTSSIAVSSPSASTSYVVIVSWPRLET
jgi:hypothetical protein